MRAARPALSSRIYRAENILVTHFSCRRQRVIRVRVRDGRPRFLVSGSAGAVYVIEPVFWECSCPDASRRGKGCKHALACWALWRASVRPVLPGFPTPGSGEVLAVAEGSGPYEMRACPGCFDGLVYDGERGTWVRCGGCLGTGHALVFVYAKAGSKESGRLRECVACRGRFTGMDLTHVGDDHLTFFEGDELCRSCVDRHGVL